MTYTHTFGADRDRSRHRDPDLSESTLNVRDVDLDRYGGSVRGGVYTTSSFLNAKSADHGTLSSRLEPPLPDPLKTPLDVGQPETRRCVRFG